MTFKDYLGASPTQSEISNKDKNKREILSHLKARTVGERNIGGRDVKSASGGCVKLPYESHS